VLRPAIIGYLAPIVLGASTSCSLLVDMTGLSNGPLGADHRPTGEGGLGGGDGGSGVDGGSGIDGASSPDGSSPRDASEASTTSTYRDVVMSDGPLAYYRLDEKSRGVAKDETGHFAGAHSANVVVGAAPLFAASEAAATFAGSDSISIDGLDFQGTQPFTVELWLSKGVADGTFRFPVYKEEGSGTSRRGYGILVINDSVAGERYVGGTGLDVRASGIGVGRVAYVVMTYSGTALALYVDGELADTNNDSRALNATVSRDAMIGSAGSGSGFTGTIDDVAVYDKALLPERIQAHFAARVP
jgi:hypothetical protein